MFSKILIANRGEIAVRLIRACREMGVSTVAVYSEADRDALHVHLADESVCIGPAPAKDSYLNMKAVLSAAMVTGAQAVHPGYGLLSENARFARLCAACGLCFIGPPADVISRMGDKDAARRTMKAAGVPVIPGSEKLESIEEAGKAALEVGYPLLIKASAGGGGRGIRLVTGPDQLERQFNAASQEALSAFGCGDVYMEKYLRPVKHIEVQVLCDKHGSHVALGERDCSVQRRNQKLLEESPSPGISEVLRQELISCSVRAAKAVGYENAGTIEYLLDRNNNFYFMEMNTRLQVEHPVTEMVTGIDLVKWQLRIAAGQPLNFTQEDVRISGCAIECRINAEDPARGNMPCAGKVTLLHAPGGPWVRLDTALYQDYVVPPFYDSMIAKLIVHAKTREEALRKMQAALGELVIEGVAHNSELQMELLQDERFVAGSYTTDFMSKWG